MICKRYLDEVEKWRTIKDAMYAERYSEIQNYKCVAEANAKKNRRILNHGPRKRRK
jgi:hypothetical protein